MNLILLEEGHLSHKIFYNNRESFVKEICLMRNRKVSMSCSRWACGDISKYISCVGK